MLNWKNTLDGFGCTVNLKHCIYTENTIQTTWWINLLSVGHRIFIWIAAGEYSITSLSSDTTMQPVNKETTRQRVKQMHFIMDNIQIWRLRVSRTLFNLHIFSVFLLKKTWIVYSNKGGGAFNIHLWQTAFNTRRIRLCGARWAAARHFLNGLCPSNLKIKKHLLNYNDTSQHKINAVFSLHGLSPGVFDHPLEGGGWGAHTR